jgi:regulator of cell morphogenesis and NO signaling
MAINMMNTVRELALTIPGATRVFEQMGIDYCCGGNRTLVDACGVAKVPFETALVALENSTSSNQAATQERDWSETSLSELIDFIVDTHHVFTRQELIRLERLIEKVCLAHQQNHPELKQLDDQIQALMVDLTPHMAKEEQVLFPYIVAMEQFLADQCAKPHAFFVTVQNPVRMMMKEHDSVGDLLREIRTTTDNFELPADACMTFKSLYDALQALEADLHQHIHLENNVLFPKSIAMEELLGSGSQSLSAKFDEAECVRR